MNPSFFSSPAVFAAMPEAEGGGGEGDVEAGRDAAQPAATLEMKTSESADALFIMPED